MFIQFHTWYYLKPVAIVIVMGLGVQLLNRHLCCWQNPVLWDECSNGSGGRQSGDNTAGPGHEEDGAVCGQTTRRDSQRERGHQTFRWRAQREEMYMLDQEAIQETMGQRSVVCLSLFSPHSVLLLLPDSFLIACLFIFDCMFVHFCLFTLLSLKQAFETFCTLAPPPYSSLFLLLLFLRRLVARQERKLLWPPLVDFWGNVSVWLPKSETWSLVAKFHFGPDSLLTNALSIVQTGKNI